MKAKKLVVIGKLERFEKIFVLTFLKFCWNGNDIVFNFGKFITKAVYTFHNEKNHNI